MNKLMIYHLIITGIFIYILIQFLTLKRENVVYRFYDNYIMNRYCVIVYLLLSLIIYHYDSYTGILLVILIIPAFKSATKEFFTNESPIPTYTQDGQTLADIPRPTPTSLQDTVNSQKLIDRQYLGVDNRFKVDEIAVNEILRQIKSQVDFDPYKTNLDKSVIYEIYNRYFDNDIFVKLKKNNNDSEAYLAAGNFNYVPTIPRVDYDLITYQNLSDNTQLGIDPLTDGIDNSTKINRGN